jgi:hypothetical protein
MSLVFGSRPVLGEYLKLNKNILIAFSVSIAISAIVAQALSEQEYYLNTTYTLIADYVSFFSIFGILYYFDNRKKYRLESGATDKIKLKRDLLRLLTSLGIAEVVYNIVRWLLQYYLLLIDYDPYLASVASQVVSMIVYLIVMNLSMKMTRSRMHIGHSAVKMVHWGDRLKLFKKKPTQIQTETLFHPIEDLPTEALYQTYNKLLDMYNETLDQKLRIQLIMISEILQKRG